MASLALPDYTGTNPSYAYTNMPWFVYETGVKYTFPNSPVFKSNLSIILVDGSKTPLVMGTDWVINPDDIDQTAMGLAFTNNPDFNDVLAKSVTFTSSLSLSKKIAMDYQEFYLTNPARIFDNGLPLELTPDLIKGLLSDVAGLRQASISSTSSLSSNYTVPSFLPLDINATNPGNVVSNEPITLNTISGARIIRLGKGDFFWDSLSLTYNGTPLNSGTDFQPLGASALIAQTTNTSGIYKYAVVNAAVSGTIEATYHAVGGDVSPLDVESLYTLMTDIKSFLSDSTFVTPDSIQGTDFGKSMLSRVVVLENEMRSLLTGPANYGDATSGKVINKGITSVDSAFHWWNVASLYKVAGSSTIVTADRFKGRIFFPTAQVALTFSVDFNMNVSRNPAGFETCNLVFDPLYTLFGDASVTSPVYPMVRLVWNNSANVFSGAWLQVGLPLLALNDTMASEDMSGLESCWILDPTGKAVAGNTVTPVLPSDNGFVLPDGSSVWTSGAAGSYSKTFVPSYNLGYLVYSGSAVTLSTINTTANTSSNFPVSLPTYFNLNSSKELLVTLTSADSTTVYDVVVPLQEVATRAMMGSVVVAATTKEVFTLNVSFVQSILGVITLSLNITDNSLSTTTSSGSSFTDVIRYVRVKV